MQSPYLNRETYGFVQNWTDKMKAASSSMWKEMTKILPTAFLYTICKLQLITQ